MHRPKTDADKRSATVDPSLSMPPRNVTLPYIVDEPRVILRTTGRLVHASELPKVSMDVVRAAFREHGFVEWIAYKSGETVAFALYDKKKKKEDKKEAEEEAMKEAEEVAGWKEEEEKPAAEGDKEEKKEEAQIDLVEKVLKRMAEKSGEEGKMKLADDLVVVRRATGAFDPRASGRCSTDFVFVEQRPKSRRFTMTTRHKSSELKRTRRPRPRSRAGEAGKVVVVAAGGAKSARAGSKADGARGPGTTTEKCRCAIIRSDDDMYFCFSIECRRFFLFMTKNAQAP